MDQNSLTDMLDSAKDFAGSVTLMKNELIERGWSPEIAEAIVLTTLQGWANAQRQ